MGNPQKRQRKASRVWAEEGPADVAADPAAETQRGRKGKRRREDEDQEGAAAKGAPAVPGSGLRVKLGSRKGSKKGGRCLSCRPPTCVLPYAYAPGDGALAALSAHIASPCRCVTVVCAQYAPSSLQESLFGVLAPGTTTCDQSMLYWLQDGTVAAGNRGAAGSCREGGARGRPRRARLAVRGAGDG